MINPTENPVFAGNGIGDFIIGWSPVGTRPPLNIINTVASEYANSPTLMQLIWNTFNYFEPAGLIDDWFDNIWNIVTAQGYGLDVWGRIVGVSRILEVANAGYFGFEEALPTSLEWNQGIFYSGTQINNNFLLSDDSFRILILAKAMANICNGSAPQINQILLTMFPQRGNCYVQDNGNMTMDYVFDFQLSSVEISIVEQSGVLPNPSGMVVTIVIN